MSDHDGIGTCRAMARGMVRLAAAALVFGGLGVVGLGPVAGTAQADGPHRWCPGDPKNMPYVPNDTLDWDWNICHTWFSANYGQGNVTAGGRPIAIWEGDNPPPDAITPRGCPPIAFMCP